VRMTEHDPLDVGERLVKRRTTDYLRHVGADDREDRMMPATVRSEREWRAGNPSRSERPIQRDPDAQWRGRIAGRRHQVGGDREDAGRRIVANPAIIEV